MSKSLLTLLAFLVPLCSTAADWPQYMGPNRDGTSPETGWNMKWDETEPPIAWKAEVGFGCASLAVAGGKAYTTGNSGNRDTVYCLDAGTGQVLWTHSYKESLQKKFYFGGTSATPVVDGERVYTLSKDGKLLCLNSDSGAVIWERDYKGDFSGRKPMWGWAASPLILGDRLIIDPGAKKASVIALNKRTGEVIWESGTSKSAYASPLSFREGRAVVLFQEDGLNGYEVATGNPLFQVPWKTKYGVNASIPVRYGEGFFISSSYGSGGAFVSLKGESPTISYRVEEVALQFQNGVRVGEHLYAASGRAEDSKAVLHCLNLASGRITWSEPVGGDIATVIAVGGRLIIQNEWGELILAQPNPSQFEEIGRVQVLPKMTWATPAFSNGRIYCRTHLGKVVAVDVRE